MVLLLQLSQRALFLLLRVLLQSVLLQLLLALLHLVLLQPLHLPQTLRQLLLLALLPSL